MLSLPEGDQSRIRIERTWWSCIPHSEDFFQLPYTADNLFISSFEIT